MRKKGQKQPVLAKKIAFFGVVPPAPGDKRPFTTRLRPAAGNKRSFFTQLRPAAGDKSAFTTRVPPDPVKTTVVLGWSRRLRAIKGLLRPWSGRPRTIKELLPPGAGRRLAKRRSVSGRHVAGDRAIKPLGEPAAHRSPARGRGGLGGNGGSRVKRRPGGADDETTGWPRPAVVAWQADRKPILTGLTHKIRREHGGNRARNAIRIRRII